VREIEVFARSTAPPAEVWRWLADGASWSTWNNVQRSVLEREGVPAPDGVGAIRRFSVGPGASREEVVAFEPPRHLGYVLLSGLPLRSYRADVELTPDGDGTLIAWRATLEPKLTGTGAAMEAFLRLTIKGLARALARHTSQ
jgi:Polyketide cyclase / dehydrase and lipid transport